MSWMLGVCIGSLGMLNLILGFQLWMGFVWDDERRARNIVAFLIGWPFGFVVYGIIWLKRLLHTDGEFFGIDDCTWETIGITGIMAITHMLVIALLLDESYYPFWGQSEILGLEKLLIMLLCVLLIQLPAFNRA